MTKANMDYWTPTTDFEEGGCGIINAAKDMGYPIDDVKSALLNVGIDHDSCNMVSLKA
jgi:pseudolysin